MYVAQMPLFYFITKYVVTDDEIWAYTYMVFWDGDCELFEITRITGG